MDSAAIQRAFGDVFDEAVLFHGYTDYMRDYEMLTYTVAHPRSGGPAAFHRYLFRYCVEAVVTTTVKPQTWQRSLDERQLDAAAGDLEGFVWGVRWQCLYPGATLVPDSPKAAGWSEAVGIPFHEAVVETNAHKIELVFSDLEVTPVQPGYVPYVLS